MFARGRSFNVYCQPLWLKVGCILNVTHHNVATLSHNGRKGERLFLLILSSPQFPEVKVNFVTSFAQGRIKSVAQLACHPKGSQLDN